MLGGVQLNMHDTSSAGLASRKTFVSRAIVRPACIRVVAVDKTVDSEAGAEIEEQAVRISRQLRHLQQDFCFGNLLLLMASKHLQSHACECPDHASPHAWRLAVTQMEKMDKSFEAVQRSFTTVRTGRANPSMLDRVQVGSQYTSACHSGRFASSLLLCLDQFAGALHRA